MKIDVELVSPLSDAASRARELEDAGADGVVTFEGPSDPLLPLALVAAQTSLEIYPSCCVAFPRSPTHLAQTAWDLNVLADGGFKLGIASQIRPHVERRFGAVWGKPVPHMRELIAAIRAVFDSWQNGTRLAHRGEYYELTLMTPAFSPRPSPHGPPPIWLGALGPRMTALAAQAADGQVLHGMHTESYLMQHVVPTMEQTLRATGRARSDFTLAVNVIVGAGVDADERTRARESARQLVSFYASTPAYRVVLDASGWGDVQTNLNTLSKEGKWAEMASLVGDEMLDAIVLTGEPDEVAEKLRSRYGGVADRVAIYSPGAAPERMLDIVRAFKSNG